MPMQEGQAVKSCLSHCEVTLQDLQNLTNTVQDSQAKDELNQAVQSLNDCIQKCQNAASQL